MLLPATSKVPTTPAPSSSTASTLVGSATGFEASSTAASPANPSISISTSAAPTLIISPIFPNLAAITPFFGDGIAVTTLSVSIVTRESPIFTLCPFSTCHSTIVPSSKPSPISGNLNIYLIILVFYSSFNFIKNLIWVLHKVMLPFW